ncbi:carbohydrate ABC transporter permease [Agromyces silvae]|uniref:carbohydrate ABC transporter permease n=1 Tax=Agromyces silvae TaxID=3388266 RepID=UPI00280B6931|nr:carbohydrate ABC transporter permease [Agromyces protaetiae]
MTPGNTHVLARRRRRREGLRLSLTLIAALALVGLPLYVLVITAMKPVDEARRVTIDPPTQFAFFDNLATVLEDGTALRGFINSCIVAVPTILITLLLAACAAWVFGRSRSRKLNILYYVVITGIMLPPAIIPTVRVLQTLGLDGNHVGLIFFYCGTQLGAAVFLITGFVKGVPYELEEAARLDGAGPLRVFWSVILPSLRPAVLVSGVYLTLTVWNDFFYAYFVLSTPAQRTMPLGLYGYASANLFQYNWGLVFSYVLLTSVPIVIVFLLAQKRIVSGLLGGAGK